MVIGSPGGKGVNQVGGTGSWYQDVRGKKMKGGPGRSKSGKIK